jgi:hypothetical protein
MVCCSEITYTEFISELKQKLLKIPDHACHEQMYIVHDLFFFLLKNIVSGTCEMRKVASDPDKVKEFLCLILFKIDEFEQGIPHYKFPYEHEREFLNDLKDLRRVVVDLNLNYVV